MTKILFGLTVFLCFLYPLKPSVTLQHHFKCTSLHFGIQGGIQNSECITVKQSGLIITPFHKIHVIICGLAALFRHSDSAT